MSHRPSVEVQHWVCATVIQQVTGQSAHNLFQVTVDHAVPPDTEFPRGIPTLDLFLRVVGRNAGETRVRVRVHHLSQPGRWELRNDYENPRHRLPLPPDRVAFHDRPFRLPNVSLSGTGLYAVSIYFRPLDEPEEVSEFFWDRDETPWDPDEPEWEFGAVEYFRVWRPT